MSLKNFIDDMRRRIFDRRAKAKPRSNGRLRVTRLEDRKLLDAGFGIGMTGILTVDTFDGGETLTVDGDFGTAGGGATLTLQSGVWNLSDTDLASGHFNLDPSNQNVLTLSASAPAISGLRVDGSQNLNGAPDVDAGPTGVEVADLEISGGGMSVGSVDLTGVGNDFETIDIEAIDLQITDIDELQIDGLNISGNATFVSIAGDITDAASPSGTTISVGGNASFDADRITLGDDVADTTNFDTLTITADGDVAITEDSATVITGTSTAGSLSLSSDETLTDAASALTVTNAAEFSATSVTLGDGADTAEFGTLKFTSVGDVSISEAGDIDLAAGSSGDDVSLKAEGDVNISVDFTATGSLSIAADGDSSGAGSLLAGATTTLSGTDVLLSGDDVQIGNADASGTLAIDGSDVTVLGTVGGTSAPTDFDVTADSLILNAVNLAAGATPTWTTDAIAIGGAVTAPGATLTIAPKTAGSSIGIGDGAAGSLNLSAAEIANLTDGFDSITIGDAVNGTGAVDINAAAFQDQVTIVGGTITVTELSAGTNLVTLHARTGAITDGGDAGSDITALSAELIAANGIGAANALDTQVTNFAFSNAGALQANIANTGQLILADLTSIGGTLATSNSTGGGTISASSAITVNAAVTAGDDFVLQAGSPLTVNSTVVGTNDLAFIGTDIDINFGITGANVSFSGAAVDIGAAVNATAGNITSAGTTFSGIVDLDATGHITLNHTGAVSVAGTVDAGGNFSSAGTTFNNAAIITVTGDAIVNHSGQVTIDTQITADNVDLDGNGIAVGTSITATDLIDLNAGTAAITQSAGTLTGSIVNLTASTGIGTAAVVQTSASTVAFANTTGVVQITEVNAATFSGTNGSGTTTLTTTNGDLTVGAADILTNGGELTLHALAASADVISAVGSDVRTNGDIAGVGAAITIVSDDLQLGGDLNSGTGGLVTLRPQTNARQIHLGASAVDGLMLAVTDVELNNIISGGGVTIGSPSQTGNITVVGTADQSGGGIVDGTFTLQTGSSININATLSNAVDTTLLAGGNIVFGAAGAITAVGHAVDVTSTSGSIQGSGANLTNVTAGAATLNSATAIGASGIAVETQVSSLSGAAGNGGFFVSNSGSVAIGLLSATTTVDLRNTGGAITDGNAGANNINAASAMLFGTAGVGTGADVIESAVNNVEGDGGTAGFFLNNTGDLVIGGVDGSTTGITATNAAIAVSAQGNVTLSEEIATSGGSVSVSATGAIIDGNNAANNVAASAFTASAGTGIGSADAIETNVDTLTVDNTSGNVAIAEVNDVTFANNVRNQAIGGTLTITAGGTIDTSTAVTSTNNGTLTLDANGTGSDVAIGTGNVTAGGGGININADNDVHIGGNVATAGNIQITADAEGNNAGATTHSAGIVSADVATLSGTRIGSNASSLRLSVNTLNTDTSTTDGDQFLSEDNSLVELDLDAGDGDIVLTVGGSIGGGGDVTTDIAANSATLVAVTGIGDGVSGDFTAIETAVTHLAARTDSGDINIANTGALTITTLGGVAGASIQSGGASDEITIVAASPLTVASDVTGSGNITLTATDDATDTPGNEDDLTVNSGVTIQSTGADVTLQGGDDVTISAGSTINAADTVNIAGDFGNADAAGSTIDVLGNIVSTNTTQIVGNSDGDDITFNPGASSSGAVSINGEAGDDSVTVWFGNFGGAVTVVNDTGEGTDDLTLNGTTGDDTFTINGTSTTLGSETVGYDANLEDVIVDGGIGVDTFNVSPATDANTDITVNGAAPTGSTGDVLNFTVPTNESITPSGSGTGSGSIATSNHGDVSFTGIEDIVLNGSTDLILTGTADIDVLEITATDADSGSFLLTSGGVAGPSIEFSGVTSFRFDGGDNDDIFRVNNPAGTFFNPTGGITFNGNDGDDTLEVLGGSANNVEHRFTNNSDGSILYNGEATATIVYTGLAPVIDTITATTRTFTFTGGAETITVTDSATPGQTTIDSTLGESVSFVSPSASITINAGSGDDIININGIDTSLTASLSINGDAGADVINVGTNLTLGSATSTGDLTFNAEATVLTADVTLDTTGAGSDGNLSVTGTLEGAFNLTTNVGGTSSFTGAVGSNTAIGDGMVAAITINGAGTTEFSSMVNSASGIVQADAAGTITFREDVAIAAGNTGTSLNADVVLDGLTLLAAGAIRFGNIAGADSTILTGNTMIDTSTANRAVTFNSAVTGAHNLTVSSGNGTVDFNGTVNDIVTLTVNSGGATSFNAAVGGTAPLTTITTDAAGTVNVGANVNTATIDFNETANVTLTTNAELDAATIDIAGGIIGAFTLTLDGSTSVNVNGTISTTNLTTETAAVANAINIAGNLTAGGGDLTTTGAGGITVGGNVVTSAVNVTSAAGITVNGTTSLGGNLTAQSGNIMLGDAAVDAVTLTADAIFTATTTVNLAGGIDGLFDVTFAGAAGNDVAGTIGANIIDVSVIAGNLTAGAIDITGDLTSAAGLNIETDAGAINVAGDLTTGGTLIAQTDVNVGGDSSLGGDVTAENGSIELGTNNADDVSLSADAVLTATAAVNISGDVTGAFDATFAGATGNAVAGTIGTNINDVSVTAGNLTAGTIDISGDLTSAAGLNIETDAGAVNVDGDLTTGGTLIAQTDVTVGGDSSLGGDVTAEAGDAIFGNAAADTTTLTNDVVVTTSAANGNATFAGNVTGAQLLTIVAGTGTVDFLSTIGGSTALSGLSIASAGALNFDNVVAVDDQGIDITAGTVTFDNAVTTTNNGDFEITNSDTATFAAAANLMLAGEFTANGSGGVSTAGNITTTGEDITFSDGVTLTGAVVLNTGAAGGNVTFDAASGTVNGTQNLTISAGSGDVSIDAALGGTSSLGNLTIASANVVNFDAAVTAANVTATGVSIDGGSLVTATTVTLNATSGIGANTALELAASSISADTTTGNIDIDNTLTGPTTVSSLTTVGGAITFEQSGGGDISFSGPITSGNAGTTGGAISLIAADALTVGNTVSSATGSGGTLAINNATINGAVTVGAGDVTISGGGIDLIVGAQLNAGDINLTAARDVIVSGVVQAGGNITVTADSNNAGDVNAGDDAGGVRILTAGQLNAVGDVTVTGSDLFAVPGSRESILIDADTVATNNQIVAGGNIGLTDSGNAPATAATIINGRIETTGVAADVTISAEADVSFGIDGSVAAVGGTITVTADTAGGNNNGQITMADGASITATTGTISLTADGNVTLSQLSTGGLARVTSSSGAITDAGDAGTDIVAGNAALRAVTGIGATDQLDIDVTNLAFTNTTSGDVNITDLASGVTVDSVDGLLMSNNAGNAISLTANSPLTIAVDTTTVGTLTLTAVESTGPSMPDFDHITVNAGVAVESTEADVVFNAGDDIVLAVGSTVTAATTVSLSAGVDDNDGDGAIRSSGDITGSGSVTLTASEEIALLAAADVITTTGNTLLTATTGGITMTDAATIDGGSGTVTLQAAGNVAVSEILTTNATNSAVSITSTGGNITDAGDAGTDITAAGRATLIAANGIGATDALDTSITSLVLNNTAGDVQLTNDRAMEISTAFSGGDITLCTTAGNVALAGDVSTGAASTLRLSAAGSVLQTAGNITTAALGVVSSSGISLTSAGNSANTVALNGGTGNVTFIAADGYSVGAVSANDCFVGATGIASGGEFETKIASGDITIDAAVVVTGTARLEATTGAITQGVAGSVSATNLAVRSADEIDLDQTANNVTGIFAATSTAAGAIDFSNDPAFTVGMIVSGNCITAITGVSTADGDILLSVEGATAADDLTIDADVTAGTNGSVRLFAGDTLTIGSTAPVTVSAETVGEVFLFAGSDRLSNLGGSDAGDITMFDGSQISSASGNIGLSAARNIAVSRISTTGDASLRADSRVTNNAGSPVANFNLNGVGVVTDVLTGNGAGFENITATNVQLTAATGIGTEADAIDTNITAFTAETQSGDISIADVSGLRILPGFDVQFSPASGLNIGTGTTGVRILDTGSGAGMIDSTTDNIVISAEGTIDVGAAIFNDDGGNISLTANGAGSDIVLQAVGSVGVTGSDGTVDGDGNITLTAADEITLMNGSLVTTANGLIDASAGNNITVSDLMNLGGEVHIDSTAGAIIDADNAVGNDITATSVAIRAANGIGGSGQAGAIETAVSNLAFNNSSGGLVHVINTGDLNVSNVDGITSSANSDADVKLQVTGNLSLDEALTAGTGNILLDVSGDVSQNDNITANGLALMVDGSTTLTNATNDVTNFAANNGGAIEYIDNTALNVGTIAVDGMTIAGITTSDDNVTLCATAITLGDNVAIGVGTLRLSATTGSVTQTGGTILAQELGAKAATGIALLSAGNDVEEFAADGGTGSITLVDSDGYSIGEVTAEGCFNATVTGITTGGDFDSCVTTGEITLTSAINANGTVRLEATAGNITQTISGMVTADDLGARANGNIALNLAANDINTFAAESSNGDIAFNDANDVIIATVSAGTCFAELSGVTTTGGNGNINVFAATDLTGNDTVTADGSGSVTLNADAGTFQSNAAVSSATGNIDIDGNVVSQNADITTAGAGTISVTADDGGITMADGTTSSAATGAIRYDAVTNAALSELNSSGGSVDVTATTGNITDNRSGEGVGFQNILGTVATLTASGNIGGTDDIDTAVDTLNASSTTAGSIDIAETDAIDLIDVDTVDGPITVVAGGQITATDVRSLTDTDANDISLTSTGAGIEVVEVIAGGGTAADLILDAQNGDITNSGTSPDVVADNLNASATGSITLDTTINTATVVSSTAGDITLYETDTIVLTDVDTVDGSITVNANGAINATDVDANGGPGDSVSLTASIGDITATSITAADSVVLHAIAGTVNAVSVTAETGDIDIDAQNDVIVTYITATAGNVDITADTGDVLIDTIAANGANSVVTITATTGSVLDSNNDAAINISANQNGTVTITAGADIGAAGTSVFKNEATNPLEIDSAVMNLTATGASGPSIIAVHQSTSTIVNTLDATATGTIFLSSDADIDLSAATPTATNLALLSPDGTITLPGTIDMITGDLRIEANDVAAAGGVIDLNATRILFKSEQSEEINITTDEFDGQTDGDLTVNSDSDVVLTDLDCDLTAIDVGDNIAVLNSTVAATISQVLPSDANQNSRILSGSLVLNGMGTFDLTNGDNDTNVLAGSNVGAITFKDIDDITIDTVDVVTNTPATINGLSSGNNDIQLDAGTTLTINQPLNAGTANARLQTKGDIVQSDAGIITADQLGIRQQAAAGNITLAAQNDVNILAISNVASSGSITFADADEVTVGEVTRSEISDSIFEEVTGISSNNGDITIDAGTATVGPDSLSLTEAVNAGTADVRLIAEGNVTQTDEGIITANRLGVRQENAFSGDIVLDDANVIDEFSAVNQASGGVIALKNTQALTVGTVAALDVAATPVASAVSFAETNGIMSTNGDVLIDVDGPLSLNQQLNAGTADVRINAAGQLQQTATGLITANELGIRQTGPGNVSLGDAANDVDILAVDNDFETGGITFFDSDDLTIGEVLAQTIGELTFETATGLDTNAGDINVTSTDDLSINNDINAAHNTDTASVDESITLISRNGDITLADNTTITSDEDPTPGVFDDITGDSVTIIAGSDSGTGTVVLGSDIEVRTDGGVARQLAPRPTAFAATPTTGAENAFVTISDAENSRSNLTFIDGGFLGVLDLVFGVAGEENLQVYVDWGAITQTGFNALAGDASPSVTTPGAFEFELSDSDKTIFYIDQGGQQYLIPHVYEIGDIITTTNDRNGREINPNIFGVRFSVAQHASINVWGATATAPAGPADTAPPDFTGTSPSVVAANGDVINPAAGTLALLSSTDTNNLNQFGQEAAQLPFDNRVLTSTGVPVGQAEWEFLAGPSPGVLLTETTELPELDIERIIPPELSPIISEVIGNIDFGTGASSDAAVGTDVYLQIRRYFELDAEAEVVIPRINDSEFISNRGSFEEFVEENPVLQDGAGYEVWLITETSGQRVERPIVKFEITGGRPGPATEDLPETFEPYELKELDFEQPEDPQDADSATIVPPKSDDEQNAGDNLEGEVEVEGDATSAVENESETSVALTGPATDEPSSPISGTIEATSHVSAAVGGAAAVALLSPRFAFTKSGRWKRQQQLQQHEHQPKGLSRAARTRRRLERQSEPTG